MPSVATPQKHRKSDGLMTPRNPQNLSLLVAACLALVPLSSPAALTTSTSDSLPWIFYADNDLSSINRVRLDGSSQEVLGSAPAAQSVSVDPTSGQVFWSDLGVNPGGQIVRSNLDGSSRTLIHTGSGGGHVVVDARNSHVYWSDLIKDQIMRSDFDGGNLATVYQTPIGLNQAIELDATRGILFFETFERGIGPRIERVNVDGTGHQVVSQSSGYSMSLDEANKKIFVADWFNREIVSLNYEGTGLTEIASPSLPPRDVQVFGEKLYFADVRSELVNGQTRFFNQWIRTDLDGSNREVVHETNRGQGLPPADMISFQIVSEPLVIPEPSTATGLLVVLTMFICAVQRCERSIRLES